MKSTLKFAFIKTIPILLGYLFLGVAFGLLLTQAGYGVLWALAISLFVYAGSMQFVLISFLSGGISLFSAILLTFSVNSRHIFYGLSFIQKFKAMGKRFFYMVFSLTDETYSLLCSVECPQGMNEQDLHFTIALLNQSYWIAGSVLGATLGELIRFNTAGVDFAMTALFVVIFVEQWLAAKTHIPALIGLACGLLGLLLLGADAFILPALVGATALLLLCKGQLNSKLQA